MSETSSSSAKVLYIVVVDENGNRDSSFRYTRSVLQSSLQLMGCKPRHAFKISSRVFEVIRNASKSEALLSEGAENVSGSKPEASKHTVVGEDDKGNNVPFEVYKSLTTVEVRREIFLDVVCDALAEYKYIGPNQRADLVLACRIRERKESVTVLLCGTSGCGKSTLSSLLGSRLGITTVISTDSIRHMMRSFADEKQNPLLWASTYHAGECLDPVAVAKAKAKKTAKKSAGSSQSLSKDGMADSSSSGRSDSRKLNAGLSTTELISSKHMAVEGYKAQSEMVIDSLDRLITAWEERKESVIIEGVHLSLNFVMGLMKKHPSIIPFMIYIANEEKHLERFAVRAKYMTLDPAKNKYVKYIRNIRTIQEYLCQRADKHLVPKINNTNVDKSVAAIHATVFSCFRRCGAGEQLYDTTRNTVFVVDEEYRNQRAANSLSSKGMFQLIQRKGSSRQLMALINTDGSVAKAWPVDPVDSNGNPLFFRETEMETGRVEQVNLQFGLYGLSTWPKDGGPSCSGSIDGSRGDDIDIVSRHLSSCCSSPRSERPAKELMEDNSVHGSDEEVDESADVGSDEDFSDDEKQFDEEIGSVDEDSTKSDEEYEDLAMQDIPDNGYCWSDDAKEHNCKIYPVSEDTPSIKDMDKYQKNLDRFVRTRGESFPEPLFSYTSMYAEKNEMRSPCFSNVKMRKRRSLSIPALSRHGSEINGSPILSGAPWF